jgi:hypothetical protein
LPRTNLIKVGIATSAAAVGAALAITSVFAHSTPTTHKSLVSSIVTAAHAASLPVFANDPVPNAQTDAAELKAEAAEAAAELAAEQAAAAAKAAKAAAAQAAEAADADDVDEEVDEDVDDQPAVATAAATQAKVEKSHSADHETD